MRHVLLRCWTWLSPSIAIAVAAAVGGAFVEGAGHAGGPAVAAVGAGEGLALVAPWAAIAISLARGIRQGWRPTIAGARGAIVLAGLGTGAAAIGFVFAAGYASASFGARATKLGWFAAMIAGAGAAAAAALALAVAPLLVRGGGWVIDRVWPTVTPRRALRAAALVTALLAVAGWLAARPWLVRYDLGIAAYGAGFVGAGAVATLAVMRWRTARPWIGVGALAAGVATWAAARLVAASDPTALLDAWSQLPVSGYAIELRRDVGQLRADVLAAVPALVPERDRHPDILIVTVDALRADRVAPAVAPAMHALGSEAVVLERAYAPSTVTRGSLPPIMTSLSPGRIRGRLIDFATKLDPRHVLLAERLQRAGYTTRGFLCCRHHFGGPRELGLDRGLAEVLYDPDGGHLAHAATTFFEDPSLDGAPRFAWLHTYEPHLWVEDLPLGALRRGAGAALRPHRPRRRPRAGAAARGDPRAGPPDDHRDHRRPRRGARRARRPAARRCPVHQPDPRPAADRGAWPRAAAGRDARRLIGLGATVLELAGFSPPPSDGPSFARLLLGPPPAQDDAEAYSVVLHDRVIPFTAHSLVVGDHHLIEVAGHAPELYDLRRRPGRAHRSRRARACPARGAAAAAGGASRARPRPAVLTAARPL